MSKTMTQYFPAAPTTNKRQRSCYDVREDGNKPPALRSKLFYVRRDLFSCPATDSLAHCISEDCHMGAGIAVLFKKKFGEVNSLLAQKKQPGECAVLKTPDRYVYYLVTKKRYFNKPTYETLRRSLEAMKAHCLANKVTRISMPRIGCGLDLLNWDNVSVMIEEVFQGTGVTITVYTPDSRPKPPRPSQYR